MSDVRPYLIALTGEPGAGKDAIGSYLVEQHGFTRYAFADRLKQACEALNPIVTYRIDRQLVADLSRGMDLAEVNVATMKPVRLLEAVGQYGWDEAKRRYPEVRRTQRYLATEVVRDLINPTYWVDYVAAQLLDHGRIVITDLRFPNEAEMVESACGSIWWVSRGDNPHRVREQHVSEAWHPSKYVPIRNEGTLDELYDTVELALSGELTLLPY